MSENISMRIIRLIRPLPLEKSLAQLREKLDRMDFQPPKWFPSAESGIRFRLVKSLPPIRIRMDASKNHRLPHVHVDYGNEFRTTSYAIDNGVRIAGELDTKYDREVCAWILKCRHQLLKAWKLTQKGQNADAVICELLATDI